MKAKKRKEWCYMKWILENLDTLIGWLISIISTGFGIYQYNKNIKYEEIIKINNWIIYQRISNLGGVIQKSLDNSNDSFINKDLYESIVRSDALAAELHKEAIRLIIFSENDVTEQDISKWVKEGRINKGYSDLFKSYLPK